MPHDDDHYDDGTYGSLSHIPLSLNDDSLEHSLTTKNVNTLLNTAAPSTSTTPPSKPSSASIDQRPRIILMGNRRSGKTSIAKVVFQKMSPHETLFLEATTSIRLREINTSALVNFCLLDFPGNFELTESSSNSKSTKHSAGGRNSSLNTANNSSAGQTTAAGSMPSNSAGSVSTGISPEMIFDTTGSLVFVIDAQDDPDQFNECIEYFIHQVKLATTINPKIHIDVLIHKVDGDAYLSEDHKTEIQNEIKRSIADELSTAGLHHIRPSFHMTSIYDHTIFECFSKIVQSLLPSVSFLEKLLDGLIGSCAMEKTFLFDVVSKIYVATDSNPVDMQIYELCSDMIDVVIDVSCIYGIPAKATADAAESEKRKAQTGVTAKGPKPATDEMSAEQLIYDADSSATIHLSNDYVLYLREVNKYLALVCLMRSDSYKKQGLLEYNFSEFARAFATMLDAKHQARRHVASTRQHNSDNNGLASANNTQRKSAK